MSVEVGDGSYDDTSGQVSEYGGKVTVSRGVQVRGKSESFDKALCFSWRLKNP